MIDNDMIIAGADEKEHDEIMLKAIKRAEEKNMKFTKKNTIQSQGSEMYG